MTNITEALVSDNHAEMGGSAATAGGVPLTVRDILRAGERRRAERRELVAAQSAWDTEGETAGQRQSLLNDVEGRAPRGLGG
jgi:hypothetical protein